MNLLTSDAGTESHHLGRREDVGSKSISATDGQERGVDVILQRALLLAPHFHQLVQLWWERQGSDVVTRRSLGLVQGLEGQDLCKIKALSLIAPPPLYWRNLTNPHPCTRGGAHCPTTSLLETFIILIDFFGAHNGEKTIIAIVIMNSMLTGVISHVYRGVPPEVFSMITLWCYVDMSRVYPLTCMRVYSRHVEPMHVRLHAFIHMNTYMRSHT